MTARMQSHLANLSFSGEQLYQTDSLTFPLTPKVDWAGSCGFLKGARESTVVKVAAKLSDIGYGPIRLQQQV